MPAGLFLLEPDLEKFGPELPRHEETVAPLVVGGAVAEDERVGVVRESPALALVGELARLLEGLKVVDETLLALPGELVEIPAEERQPLGEEVGRHVNLLQDL